MKMQEETTPQVKIKVEGFQWEWTFLYLNEGIFVAGQTASEDSPDAGSHGASRRRAGGDRADVA